MGNQLPKTSGLSNLINSSQNVKDNKNNNSKQVVVVNTAGCQGSSHHHDRLRQLPPIVKPLIPLGQSTLKGHYPALHTNILYDFGLKLEQELRRNAEEVARNQSRLTEKIRDLEHCVGIATNSVAVERQRKVNKACESIAKLEDIDQIVMRCEADIESVLASFVKLVDALPTPFQIEPFALKSDS